MTDAHVLAFDASWGGLGWSLNTPRAPVEFGHVSLDRTWRWDALRTFLSVDLRQVLERHQLEVTEPAELRIAVERAPAVYRGAEREGKRAGNQAAIGFGLGQLAGPILLWGTRPGAWGYPWELEVEEWRAMLPGVFGRGKGWNRAACKRASVFHAAVLLGTRRGLLDAYPFDRDTGDGARGDVADAICIGHAAAGHLADAPKGPAAWIPRPPPAPRAPRRRKA